MVLGGYGNFGKRISRALAKDPLYEIIVAGHNLSKAQKVVLQIKNEIPQANVLAYEIDWEGTDFQAKLNDISPKIVIHTAGPFQNQPYTVAKACIALKIHYIDIADGRDFVVNINSLDKPAKEQEVIVISGASSVPGLSSSVVDTFAKKYALLREIHCGIASGNKIERGQATIAAILAYVGKPFIRLEKGEWKIVYGWQDLHQHYYGDNIGMRWLGNCDIPDLKLFPERYPKLHTVVFHAGLEVAFMHFLMWLMSWITRAKIIKNWQSFVKIIVKMSHWFDHFGTDNGGMFIRMYGSNHKYQPLEINWTLIAQNGDGPQIPAIASIILAKKILEGKLLPGAQPCLGLFTLEEFDKEAQGWNIYHTVEEIES